MKLRLADSDCFYCFPCDLEIGLGAEAWRGDGGVAPPLAHAVDVDSGEGKADLERRMIRKLTPSRVNDDVLRTVLQSYRVGR